MYTVYGMSSSGNCHKLRLLLDHLGLPFRWQEVDITTGASTGCDFDPGWPAIPGWDAVTGVGTPNYKQLLNAL